MLDKIIEFYKKSNNSETLATLSKKLGVEPSALEGMMEFLVKKGKLRVEYQETSGNEGSCKQDKPICVSCPLHKSKSKKNRVKYYFLAK
ncbi:MAG: FeoC-like transcriptional regulator [Candidatus Humimicrobiaceae bacterium]